MSKMLVTLSHLTHLAFVSLMTLDKQSFMNKVKSKQLKKKLKQTKYYLN
jgi:hypothetical protein